MIPLNKVEKKFKEKGIIRGSVLLFTKEDSLTFIDECKRWKIEILGIDGFYLTENTTQPSSANSVDYSVRIPNDVYAAAMNFLQEKDNDLYFEIVCR